MVPAQTDSRGAAPLGMGLHRMRIPWMVVRGPLCPKPTPQRTILSDTLAPNQTPPSPVPHRTFHSTSRKPCGDSTPNLSTAYPSIKPQEGIINENAHPANISASDAEYLRVREYQASNSPGVSEEELEKKVHRRMQKNESQRRMRELKRSAKCEAKAKAMGTSSAATGATNGLLIWRAA